MTKQQATEFPPTLENKFTAGIVLIVIELIKQWDENVSNLLPGGENPTGKPTRENYNQECIIESIIRIYDKMYKMQQLIPIGNTLCDIYLVVHERIPLVADTFLSKHRK